MCVTIVAIAFTPTKKPEILPRPEMIINNKAVTLVKIPNGRCTGFYIRTGIIVTARHCMPDKAKIGTPITVELNSGLTVITTLIGFGEGGVNDFAILKDPENRAVSMHNYNNIVYSSSLCANIRYDGVTKLQTMTPCIVGSPSAEWMGFIVVHGIVNPGDSGGPLVDANGLVIGVMVQTNQSTFEGAAVYIWRVINKLDEIQRQ